VVLQPSCLGGPPASWAASAHCSRHVFLGLAIAPHICKMAQFCLAFFSSYWSPLFVGLVILNLGVSERPVAARASNRRARPMSQTRPPSLLRGAMVPSGRQRDDSRGPSYCLVALGGRVFWRFAIAIGFLSSRSTRCNSKPCQDAVALGIPRLL